MEAKHIQILSCKFGKTIEMSYHNKVDTLTYDVKDGDETPHPDLKKALVALHPYLAAAHYVLGEERENFLPKGFKVTEAGNEDTIDQVSIFGELINAYDNSVAVNSGNIPINTGELEEKIETLRTELWAFFFNNKTAVTQTEIPGFPKKGDIPEESAGDE